ncbi:hypothetical protein BJX61DRAFT_302371 [Aspergillus egyptiacus]|nr:hypothetical protein BJX61DRAFT_302371 [Aspergillus egyptiacus]
MFSITKLPPDKVPATDLAMAQEREFYKYCQLPQRPGLLDRPPVSPRREANQELLPHASGDTTLTALAQLGALRLNVHRCMISLFDRRTQYILAESTRTLSLQDDRVHVDGDALWLGSSVIPREEGVCHFVLDDANLNAGQSESDPERRCALVIPDLTKDERFRCRQYVVNAPHLRFYAGVPIRSRRGIAIGAFTVSDGLTRPNGLSDLEIRFMADTAEAIMNHLEMVRSHEQTKRGANMIAGLGNFVEGGSFPSSSVRRRKGHFNVDREEEAEQSDKDEPEDRLQKSTLHARRTHQPRAEHRALKERLPREKSPASSGSADGNDVDRSSQPNRPAEPNEVPELESPARPATPKRKRENEMTLQSGTREVFGRAARVLRESLDVEGVVFFDASVKSYAGLVRNTDDRPSDSESNSSSSEPQWSSDSDNPITSDSAAETDDFTTSDVLGFALADPEQPMGAIRETFLRSLLRNYSQGAIFNIDENGGVSSSEGSDSASGTSVSREIIYRRNEAPKVQRQWRQQKKHRVSLKEENKALMKVFPSARCVTLFPLWDSRQNRWFSGLFLWTKSPRSFSLGGELAYLYAFSNSIMAEIHRLDMELANRAHATLVGSISHELRSPLHGILGSTELLSDNGLTPAQAALVNTIEHCGRSLLDIINNMLDFAKINQFARKSRSSRSKVKVVTRHPRRLKRQSRSEQPGQLGNGMVNLISDVQLDAVLEEVTDGVFAGHCFSSKSGSLARADASMPTLDQEGHMVITSPTEQHLSALHESLTVIYDVTPDIQWLFETQAGAWRRVLMNLFGNALKYTRSGYISISLKSAPPPPLSKLAKLTRGDSDAVRDETASVTLTVKDTGKGIDKEYLQSNVFKPFSQEDPLCPGSGLGLSIVHQTVVSLGGKLDITSTKGVGTEVTVKVDLPRTPNAEITQGDDRRDTISQTKDLVRGKSVGLVGFDSPGEHIDPALALLRSSLTRMYQEHFRMDVGFVAPGSKGKTYDIYVVRSAYLQEVEKIRQQGSDQKGAARPVLVICSTPQAAQKLSTDASQQPSGSVYEFISQPCGPYKVANALRACVKRQEEQDSHPSTAANSLPNGTVDGTPSEAVNGTTNGTVNDTPKETTSDTINGTNEKQTEPLQPRMPILPPPKGPPNGAVTCADLELSPTKAVTTITTSSLDKGAVTELSARLEATRIVPSVLLVDDNTVNLQLLVAVMKKAKKPYVTASNGLEALEVYKAHAKEIQIILMDISMPVMDGLTSTREIRLFEKQKLQRDCCGFKPATIIALSGLGSAPVRQEAFNSGVDLFLSKPVRFQELIKQVDELMR